MSDLRGQQLKDSYQNVITDSGSDLAGIENGNGADITGRIVSRGSNSNGEWVRFANSTMIQFSKSIEVDDVEISTSRPSGGFRSSTISVNLPLSFSDTSYTCIGSSVEPTRPDVQLRGDTVNNLQAISLAINSGTYSIRFGFITIGTWF